MIENTIGKNSTIKAFVMQVLDKKGMLDEQLQTCVVIIDSLTDEEQNELNLTNYRNKFESLLNNIEFHRQLQKLKTINQNVELTLAYYGENYGKDPNVVYDESFQKGIRQTEKEIREFLGVIMNHILQAEEITLE